MTKSIEDYRNIVKILKLQLLKVRQENSTLSHQMGIVSQSETSSFTPKLNKYKQSDELFAKKVILFLEFAHRCELIGISPQMVFRIADKKRDKSVGLKNLTQIMKRLKIRMSDEDIDKMLNTISSREKDIQYERYLQCLSAFQINSQKFPFNSSRTFVQLSLIQFCKVCKPLYQRPRDLFNQISSDNGTYIKYDRFVSFCNKKCQRLKETQIVAIFLGLDIQSLCKIEKQIFQREIQKIYSLIDRGMTDDKSYIRQSPKKSKNQPKKHKHQSDNDEFSQQDNQGDQKLNKKKAETTKNKQKQQKLPQPSVKLDQKILNDIQKLLKVKGLEFTDLVGKLLQKEKDKKDIYLRSFSLGDISEALLRLTDKFKRKEIMDIFRKLDINQNGSTSSEQLIKLLIRVGQQKLFANLPKLFALLYRHFKQTQFPNPTLKFTSLGFKTTDKLTEQQLRLVFDKLNLSQDEMKFMFPILLKGNDITVQNFCTQLQKDPSSSRKKEFKKMSKEIFKELSELLKAIKGKRGNKQASNFKKINRLQELKATGESQTWLTIFQNEWDCFECCLQQASKLDTFWRDPEFGPTKSDQHGLRSIIGNESERPPGLPDDDDILWMTFQQIMAKRRVSDEQTFMRKDLKSTDIVQGMLGDCWYVSALSIITQNDQYVKGKPVQKLRPDQITSGVCPPLFHYFTNYGMFVFKFFKKFKPVYVIVDDLFPVQSSSNTLIFARSPELNLQWVAFAEKAYAKLHHTYSNMISGDIAQGLNDLTNSIPIKQVLKLGNQNNLDKIKQLSDQKQLMGCSIKLAKDTSSKSASHQSPFYYEDQRCGLLAGHAYSIIDYIDLDTVQQRFQLIRVRNPHGHTQWILDWSDAPLNDNQQYKKLKLYQKDIDKYYQKRIQSAKQNGQQEPVPYRPGEDGQFLMNIADWNNIFNNLFIGLNQSYKQFQDGILYQTIDSWGGKKPSGVCKSKGASQQDLRDFVKNNHQYIMQVKEKTDVLMLLSQQDGRLYRGQKYPYKELVCSSIILVFRLENNERQLTLYKKQKMVDPNRSLTLQARRDVDYWTNYQPGRYAILPVRKQKDSKTNQFQFRLFADKKIKITKLGSNQAFKDQRISSSVGKTSSDQLQKDSAQKIINFLKANNPQFDRN